MFKIFFTFGYTKFQKINVMKRLLLLLMVSGIAVSHAQTVREENRAMIGKITATWCPPCGSWGWALSDEIMGRVGEDDAFYVGIFSSPRNDWGNGKFRNATATAWASQIGGNGFPSFSINGIDKSTQNTSGSGVNTAGIKTDVYAAFDAYIAQPVVAGTGYWYKKEGTNITVQIKTKFFQDATGEFYVGAYLLEDGALNAQNAKTNTSGTIEHHSVLRGSMGSHSGTAVWGTKVVDGSVSASEEFETSYEVDIASEPEWDIAKMKVVTIIWKKNGSAYEYLNGNDKNDFPASVSDVQKGMSSLAVYPNPAAGHATLSVMMEQAADVQIRLMDISGSVIYSEQARFNSGMNAWNIETSGYAAGTYLLSVSSARGTLTQRLAVVK